MIINSLIDCINTSIGELCIFHLTIGSQIELYEELGKSISESNPTEFVRKLSRQICFPKESLKENKYKPKEPVLSVDEIASLTEDDLEAIAQVYVENNDYLFRKLVFETSNETEAGTKVNLDKGEIEYPRGEKESFTQYLTRLSIIQKEKQTAQFKKLYSGITNFSNTLGENIKKTFLMGNSLKREMESIRPSYLISESGVPNITDLTRRIEENRLKPFNELASRLDQLIEASAQAVEFSIEANKIQTEIAEEIKSSSDENTKFAEKNIGIADSNLTLSKKNITLSKIVIGLTVLGIGISFFISAYTSYQTKLDGDIQLKKNEEYVNLLAEKLTNIDKSISLSKLLETENERLKAQLTKQEKEIRAIRNQLQKLGEGLDEKK